MKTLILAGFLALGQIANATSPIERVVEYTYGQEKNRTPGDISYYLVEIIVGSNNTAYITVTDTDTSTVVKRVKKHLSSKTMKKINSSVYLSSVPLVKEDSTDIGCELYASRAWYVEKLLVRSKLVMTPMGCWYPNSTYPKSEDGQKVAQDLKVLLSSLVKF